MAGEKPKEGSWLERREWVRYRGAPDASCMLSLGDEPKTAALRIENISVAGIMLAVDGTLPIGAVAHVELSRTTHNFTCSRQMRVVYAFRASSGEYLVGGSFTRPLSDVELQNLL